MTDQPTCRLRWLNGVLHYWVFMIEIDPEHTWNYENSAWSLKQKIAADGEMSPRSTRTTKQKAGK